MHSVKLLTKNKHNTTMSCSLHHWHHHKWQMMTTQVCLSMQYFNTLSMVILQCDIAALTIGSVMQHGLQMQRNVMLSHTFQKNYEQQQIQKSNYFLIIVPRPFKNCVCFRASNNDANSRLYMQCHKKALHFPIEEGWINLNHVLVAIWPYLQSTAYRWNKLHVRSNINHHRAIVTNS